MLIIVEGCQGVGKSYLIKNSYYPELRYKYPFSEFSSFDIFEDNNILFGMSAGKDLSLIQYHAEHPETNTIADRSFLSSLVYRHIYKQVDKELLDNYFNIILGFLIKNPNIHIIYVIGDKAIVRNKLDGYDNIDNTFQKKVYSIYIKELYREIPDKIITFKNNFDSESVDKFNLLLESYLF